MPPKKDKEELEEVKEGEVQVVHELPQLPVRKVIDAEGKEKTLMTRDEALEELRLNMNELLKIAKE